jgi:hypothetical protein
VNFTKIRREQSTMSVVTGVAGLTLAASIAMGGNPLYSNGSADPALPALPTGAASASGVPSPLGGQWSELQGDVVGGYNAIAGFSGHQLVGIGGGAYRLAENFSISNAYGWHIDAISLFAYSSGLPEVAPVSGVNLRIWSASVGGPGSAVIYGDTTTNRLSSVTPTSYYRVFASSATPSPVPPTSDRRIWKLTIDTTGLELPQGLFWIDWQFIPAPGIEAVFAPTVTLLGSRTRSGSDAQQLRTSPDTPTAWVPIVDIGRPFSAADSAQDLAFLLEGTNFCPADFDGSGGTPDVGDIEAFFTAWLSGVPSADVDLSGGTPDTADIEVFFQMWLAGGC